MSEDAEQSTEEAGLLGILKETFWTWLGDDAFHWGASLAYYFLISLAPLVVLGITILGKVVGTGEAQRWILDQVQLLAGPRGQEMARVVMEEAGRPDLGSLGAVLTILLFLFSATAVFANLQGALNQIWAVEPKTKILKNIIRTRVAAFLMVLALLGLLLASVVVSTAVSWLGPLLDPLEAILPFVRVADLGSSLLLLWLFVAAVFWVLPDVKISLRDVWFGGLITAAILVLGKYALAAFLSRNALASMYGTAGSLFLLLMWVYFSAQVLLLGAEFTQVWARHRGRRIEPEDYAARTRTVRVDEEGERVHGPGEVEMGEAGEAAAG